MCMDGSKRIHRLLISQQSISHTKYWSVLRSVKSNVVGDKSIASTTRVIDIAWISEACSPKGYLNLKELDGL